MDSDNDFEIADADASKTIPKQCSSLRNGEYVILKGKVCKIVEMFISKPGKHGHAKVRLTGLDIFTGKKYEELCPGSKNIDVPVVHQGDYQIISISFDGFLTLMDVITFQLRSDLKLPENEIGTKIKDLLQKQQTIICTVVSALNEEKIVSLKTETQK